ncbi:hypothetical protein CFOL_v3_14510, partial [Cephalotus follicularis]
GMLKVKQLRIHKGLCHWLLKRFDLTSCTMAINNRPVNVLEADVASIFGLNNGGMDVVTLGEYGTMSKICKKLNLNDKGEIKVMVLEEELITMARDDDEFKGKFILYCFGILLCPYMEESVDRTYVYSLTENAFTDNINWAKQVYNDLLSGIRKFIVESSNYISGCVVILLVFIPCILYIIFL